MGLGKIYTHFNYNKQKVKVGSICVYLSQKEARAPKMSSDLLLSRMISCVMSA